MDQASFKEKVSFASHSPHIWQDRLILQQSAFVCDVGSLLISYLRSSALETNLKTFVNLLVYEVCIYNIVCTEQKALLINFSGHRHGDEELEARYASTKLLLCIIFEWYASTKLLLCSLSLTQESGGTGVVFLEQYGSDRFCFVSVTQTRMMALSTSETEMCIPRNFA